MKKVLIITNTCWNAFNYRKSLNRGLIKNSYQVVVLAMFDGFEKELQEMGIKVYPLKISAKGINPFEDFETLKEIYVFLRNHQPDMVFSFTIKPVLYGGLACGLLGIKNVPTLTGLGTVFIKTNWLTSLVKILYRISLWRSDYVVFQNLDDRDLFLNLKLVSSSKVKMVPGSGIDPNEFYFVEGVSLKASDARGTSSHSLQFLLVARMLWDKGILEYYEAAKELKKKYPQCRFQLLGPTGVENRTAIPKETIEYWVNEGVIEYLPETNDVRPFIADADVMVLPSYREGLPRSLLEAASMGRPLVATDVPGCRDLLKNQNGILCREKDSQSLAEAMEKMIHLTPQERQKMGSRSRQMIVEGFSDEIVVNEYLNLIKVICPT